MKLMVIDGNSIANRAFYGIRMLNAPDGTPTNAIYGFLAILQHAVDEEKPDGLCVTFDLKAPTFRHRQYEGYKAQRKPMPEELAVQMPILKRMLDAMKIPRYELEGWEADDLIGTISRKAEAQGWTCCVVTGDKDSFQLATDKVYIKHVKTRMGRTETKRYDRAAFEEEYGFPPAGMIDLKALMGDASDNIPGVTGIGEKTAMDLIGRFGSVEKIYGQLDTLEIKDAVRKKLAAGRNQAEMSYALATINCQAPIAVELEQTKLEKPDNDALYTLFRELGFVKYIEKFGLTPPAAQAPQPEQFTGACTVVEVTGPETLEQARQALARTEGTADCWCLPALDFVAVDPETAGEHTAYLLRQDTYDGDYNAALGTLLSPGVKKAGHNVKDLQRALLERGLSPEGWVFDTALAAYLLDATAGGYELEGLCLQYCGFLPAGAGNEGEGGQLSLLDGPTAAEENARRASLASAIGCLREVFAKKLTELGMDRLYYEIELPLCEVLARMELEGFLVDRQALADFGESLSGSIALLERDIYDMAGETFNINSPKQLGTVLFEKLMLPAPKKTKTGYSTSAEVLEKLLGKHPIIQSVLDYRQLAKLKSTYADGLIKVIGPDGRIRTSFQMTVTATGRLSSTEPNLQNIPVRTELGAQIRKMFVPGPGNVLVDADYSQIELRLLAHVSRDKVMTEGFATGEDVHRITASQVFDVPLEQVTALQRSRAKAVNFGIVYGIGAFSLAQDIHVSVAEAKAYMDSYLEKYSGVRDYMKAAVEKAKAEGYAVTEYGRRRYLPELKSSNFNLRSFGERVALNMPIQGTAADIMKIAMIRVSRRIRQEGLAAKLLLQVHDELIVECPEGEKERVAALLTEEMSGAASLTVPLTVEAHWGTSWAAAK